MREVVDACREEKPSPFGLEDIENVSRVTFAVARSIASTMPVRIDHDRGEVRSIGSHAPRVA